MSNKRDTEIEKLWSASDECIKNISKLLPKEVKYEDATEFSIFVLTLRLLRVYESIKALKGISCQGIFILQRALWEIAVELAYILVCFESEEKRQEYTKQYHKAFWLDYIKIKASEIGKAWLDLCDRSPTDDCKPINDQIELLINTIREKRDTFLSELPEEKAKKILELINLFKGGIVKASIDSLNNLIKEINQINIEVKSPSDDQSPKNKWDKQTEIFKKLDWKDLDQVEAMWLFRHSSILGNSSIHSASAIVSEMLDDGIQQPEEPQITNQSINESNDKDTNRTAGFIIEPLQLAYQALCEYKK